MKDRPLGVSILSILSYVGVGVNLILAFLFFIIGGSSTTLLESGELEASLTAEEIAELQAFGNISGLFYVVAVVLLLFAVLGFFVGRALWKGQNWGRVLLLIFSIMGILVSLFSLILSSLPNPLLNFILTLVLNGVIIWYLMRKKVIMYFTLKKK